MKHRRRSAALVALTVAALVVSSTGAGAVQVDGQLAATPIDTSIWVPPSPDPSGIAYDPASKTLLISDSEVNEIPAAQPNGYKGANLFQTTRTGVLQATGTTLPWSKEPAGITFVQGQLFVVDDDLKSVFKVTSPGGDGIWGTGDDTPATPKGFKTSTFNNTDPEGVAYDSKRGELLLINGQTGARFYRLTRGANGQFDGVAPGGDDVVREYDIRHYVPQNLVDGMDPEGIAYDSVRDTIVVLDGHSEAIYEADQNGGLLNKIDLTGLKIKNAADVVIAPASDGSGARNYYVVDRGLDNNSHPDENDGKIYEIKASLPPITNRPPAANAGVDQIVDVTETVSLSGAGVDSDAGDTLTYAWSQMGGPAGGATFTTPKQASTDVNFSAVGEYVLRLTVSDGKTTGFDDVVVRVYQPGQARMVTVPIAMGTDDAQEGGGANGDFVEADSADNEFGHNGATNPVRMITGLRFAGLPVPKGSEIVSATIQFKVDEGGTEPASYTIAGHDVDNSPTFVHGGGGDISKRLQSATAAKVAWKPPPWSVIGDAGPDQRTPDLKAVLQEIVDRPGWARNHAASFIVYGPESGTGRRTAEAKDGLTPPVLMVEFKTAPANQPPVVDAGADQAVTSTLPATVDLKGTVTDDGLPGGSTVTSTWSKVSGPGTVTFANAAAPATKATFSAAGDYVLKLAASDGSLAGEDTVKITLTAPAPPPPPPPPPTNKAPVVDAGPDQTEQSTLPAGFDLKGKVSDDGLPSGSKVSSTWSKVSGPGSVSFADKSAPATKVTVGAAGTYVLRLTASDGALSASDDVTVTVTTGDAATAVTLDTQRHLVAYKRIVRLDGVVTSDGKAASGASVNLFVRSAGGAPELVATTTSRSDGTFTFAHRPEVNSSYFVGSGETGSNAVAVRVRPRMGAHLRHGSVLAGTRTVIAGFVSPTIAGHELRLQKWNGSRWRTVRKTLAPAADRLTFRFLVRPQRSGLHRYRVVSPPQGDRARAVAVGKQLWLRTYHATIMRVNPDADVIVVRNTGRVRFDLAGWRLIARPSGTKIALPDFVVRPGRIVRIHSGEGVDNRRNLYLGTGEMWALHGVAVLRDARLRLADRLRF